MTALGQQESFYPESDGTPPSNVVDAENQRPALFRQSDFRRLRAKLRFSHGSFEPDQFSFTGTTTTNRSSTRRSTVTV